MARTSRKSASGGGQVPTPAPATSPPAAEVQPAAPSSWSAFTPSAIMQNKDLRTAVQLVVVAAVSSPVSQLNISPVYGSLAAGLYHRYGLTLTFLLGFGLRSYLPKWIRRAVPSFCFWIPTIQYILFQFSTTLGPQWGPLVTELLTYYPLVVVTAAIATELCDQSNTSAGDGSFADAGPAMGLLILFTFVQRGARNFVPQSMGSMFLSTRIGLQVVMAVLYGLLLPQSLFWPSLPSIAFTIIGNPHCSVMRTTEVMNNTLALYDYSLLERYDSVTGYISVLQDNQRNMRVMRCDHSLLGGEWVTSTSHSTSEQVIAEPIYGVFTMLEAVRLIEPPVEGRQQALVVGLGVGTAPGALIAHGIKTTIIELDPIVHRFAVKYFNLPHNHSYFIGDAAAIMLNPNTIKENRFDYIIHDVFTGGVEPVDLFTTDFLDALKRRLKPHGAVAINYAGDLSTPAVSLIYRSITAVFPTCRVFREGAPPTSNTGSDFTNMVFFCTRTERPDGIKFRKAVTADYLGSGARKEFLIPKHEVSPGQFDMSGGVLTKKGSIKEKKMLENLQTKSALGHWEVMRTVLPDQIWENW